MRIVFIGASTSATVAASALLKRGHEIVIVERDKHRIDELTDELSCGFIHGDGSNPEILREAGPDSTDALLCMSSQDQANIIAALIGRSLGFKRVILQITNQEYEDICLELGLQDTTLPSRMIGRYLTDLVEGQDILELSRTIKGDARIFSFIASSDEAGTVENLSLPQNARVICRYRDDDFQLADPKHKIEKGDELVILTHRDNLEELRRRWKGANTRSGDN
jgi:trk system potassium uptake protein TrkA